MSGGESGYPSALDKETKGGGRGIGENGAEWWACFDDRQNRLRIVAGGSVNLPWSLVRVLWCDRAEERKRPYMLGRQYQLRTLVQHGTGRHRFQLASRWYRRGHESVNLVDRYLFWWTALEIYPGAGETNIVKNVKRVLSDQACPQLTPRDLEDRLRIGHICQGRREIRPCGGAKVYHLSGDVQRKYPPTTGVVGSP